MQPAAPRRALVAVVAGPLGEQIQGWRVRHDPKHAARLPPHLTVCYRPPDASVDVIEAQVLHAFRQPIEVRLGACFYLAHPESPLVVSVHDTESLDAARQRLFDGTYVQMGGRHEWPWHITCIRYGYKRDREALLGLASKELCLDAPWRIDRISYLESRNGRFEPLAEWDLIGSDPAARERPGSVPQYVELDEVGVHADFERV